MTYGIQLFFYLDQIFYYLHNIKIELVTSLSIMSKHAFEATKREKKKKKCSCYPNYLTKAIDFFTLFF